MREVFFNGQTAVDVVGEYARGQYSGKTKAELERQYGPLQVISLDEAAGRMEKRACADAVEIDRAEWEEGLDVLPPLKWHREIDNESFRCCEAFSGRVHTSYVRLGKRFFVMRQPITTTHAELVCLATRAMLSRSPRRTLNA